MGIGVATVGSIGIGICPKHNSPQFYTVTFVTGAPTVFVNGANCANYTTIGIATCGHPTIVLTGSAKVIANGAGTHRVGDVGINFGTYTVMTGSANVTSG